MKSVVLLVEVTGFEPATFWSRTKRATKLRYTSVTGANEGTRTPGLLITNQLLYQLSYIGTSAPNIIANLPSFVQYFFENISRFSLPTTQMRDILFWSVVHAPNVAQQPWRRIEVVITGLTRNQFAFTGTRVRIPPSPPPIG